MCYTFIEKIRKEFPKMQIYTSEDRARIASRMKNNPTILKQIEDTTADIRKKLYIQKTGLATWSHYFVCPKCGVRLIFDYYNNESFTCPNCGEVVSGEPYLGSWWNTVLDRTSAASFLLALGYVGVGREDYLKTAKEILLGYADNYKNYEVHGGIPYNNPGRFASQVLSDAHPIYDLTRAYALIKDCFTDSERAHIENDLFRPASEHQIKYLTPQIHNHEVAICTSIAAIGLAIDDPELVKYATDTKYGLKYQIDNAYLADNFWFEGSTGYHIFSLYWFMSFEMIAKNTEFSLLSDPHYGDLLHRAMLFPKNIYVGNNSTVKLNDGGGSLAGNDRIYEHAYAVFKDEKLLPLLAASYKGTLKREASIYALIYGVDTLPESIPEIKKKNYLSPVGSQIAMVHGSEDRYLMLKAMPYGGEHDHYDRLGISFSAFGRGTCEDFGTAAGYGSPLHYGYFKNTASHNTVVINGENMAPCDTCVNEYRVNAPDDIYLDAETLPPEEYEMLDSFTIKQWSDEAYRGVRMRRVISWHDKYFIDVFSVKSDNALRKEWTLHIDARFVSPREGRYVNGISSTGAQSYIKNAYIASHKGVTKLHYEASDYNVDVHTLADGLDIVNAEGPNNPADKKLSYLIERTSAECPVYVNVIEAYKGSSVISSVEASIDSGVVTVKVTETSGRVRTLSVEI